MVKKAKNGKSEGRHGKTSPNLSGPSAKCSHKADFVRIAEASV
jgi:hypothetical protein